jgi:hypothetical protein
MTVGLYFQLDERRGSGQQVKTGGSHPTNSKMFCSVVSSQYLEWCLHYQGHVFGRNYRLNGSTSNFSKMDTQGFDNQVFEGTLATSVPNTATATIRIVGTSNNDDFVVGSTAVAARRSFSLLI